MPNFVSAVTFVIHVIIRIPWIFSCHEHFWSKSKDESYILYYHTISISTESIIVGIPEKICVVLLSIDALVKFNNHKMDVFHWFIIQIVNLLCISFLLMP